jgi:hypothetical protein
LNWLFGEVFTSAMNPGFPRDINIEFTDYRSG